MLRLRLSWFRFSCTIWCYRSTPSDNFAIVWHIWNLTHQFVPKFLFIEKMPSQLCFRQIEHVEAETKWRHFTDDIFKRISWNGNFWMWNTILLKCVREGLIDNTATLSEARLLWFTDAYICVTRPQWVITNMSPKAKLLQFDARYRYIITL